MKKIEEIIKPGIHTVGIAGHVNPDGDCVGSTTALQQYLNNQFPELKTDLYLELPKKSLRFLKGVDESRQEADKTKTYDLFITCDVSERERIGVAGELFDKAKFTVCIDHHVSNAGFAMVNHIVPDASSCAEVLTDLMDPEKIDTDTAISLYTGIIHDSGVFQYSNTSPHTMRCAALLMEKGFNHNKLIDDSFNKRTYAQNRILGYALMKSRQELGGRVITSSITLEEMKRFDVTQQDLDMIVSQLRLTEGAEAAVFAYERNPGDFKVSLRSNAYLDVAEVAGVFGGGGHARAAGCSGTGTADEVIQSILPELEKRLR